MIREASATTAQRNLSELLNKVQFQHEQFIITDAGKPVATLVDMMIFEKIRQNEQAFQSMIIGLDMSILAALKLMYRKMRMMRCCWRH